jgi:hypothetical protein
MTRGFAALFGGEIGRTLFPAFSSDLHHIDEFRH